MLRSSRLILIAVFGLVPTGSAVGAEELTAGVATADITPARGARMAGYYAERLNTGTLDPLEAKAIVFRQGDTRAALVVCDLIGMPREVTRRARELARDRSGIPVENIAIAATHSHTAPVLEGDFRAGLPEKLAGLILRARDAVVPARLESGVGREERLSFNRRFHMKNGPVRFNPGPGNPDIVRAAGPIDPDVGLLLVRPAAGGEPVALLTVFALHLDTVGGTQYSADYPHVLETVLREALGGRVVSLFGAGTCGDINHIDVAVKDRRSTREIGATLAKSVLAELPRLRPVSEPSLAVRSITIELPIQSTDLKSYQGTPQDVEAITTSDRKFLETVRDAKLKRLRAIEGPTYAVEVQAIRLSADVAIVLLPGEVFVELGLAIKRASPFRTTLVIELANDAPAYIPTKKAFSEGSYETINSVFAPGGGERIVDAAVGLLEALAKR